MKTVVFLIVARFAFCSSFAVDRSGKSGESELVSVAVLYRHGDKTPTTSFPNDPYFDLSYWPMGLGQLTNKGKARHYDLGRWFRNRYSSFLPEEYSAKDIYVRSTDVDRTLMSAAANLAGLYPPKNGQVWNGQLMWQPVPIHTVPTGEDQALYMERDCAKYQRLYDAEYNADFFRKVNEDYAEFYREVSGLTGWNVTDVHFFAQLQSALYVYGEYNASYLPAWSGGLDMEKVEYLAGLNYARYTFTDKLKRLGDGPFFDNLFARFDGVMNGTGAQKFLMLSAHESTLASVLNGMQLFDYRAPAFASCVIWEVRRNSGGYYVNLYYKRNSTDAVDQLEIKDCGLDCDYDKFKTLLRPITVDLATWDKECTEK